MSVATRRALVRQLADQDPTLSTRAIAAQIGVSKDTVRRDLDEMRREQTQPAPDGAAAEPDDAPDSDRLVLVLDEPLRRALAALRATVGAPDTPEQNVAAARAAIRATADAVLEAQPIAEPDR
ncbi:DeoR family transcriptional regulator [Streptomyces sp. NBC_00996]|uniref:DeoR family transcriptional regulator n=1 Tax=Streptomyces sp. NBC_00996 TaxID=2903710 RepID=UPI00386CB8D6|nr:DeoR family transcriptional regulator [Streptomyces sp. NBC_00996]